MSGHKGSRHFWKQVGAFLEKLPSLCHCITVSRQYSSKNNIPRTPNWTDTRLWHWHYQRNRNESTVWMAYKSGNLSTAPKGPLLVNIFKELHEQITKSVAYTLGQLNMANMWSEYVKWLDLETFLHPNSKTVFVFAFPHLEVNPTFFALKFFFVLNLQCKIPQLVFWGKVNFEAQILECELKLRCILISIVLFFWNLF